jgi:6-phosphogluconolactonase (cycloisomerase 2 family)
VTISIDPTAIAVEPSGRYVYAAGSSATGWQVVVLEIDQSTGALTEVTGPGSGLDTGTQPVSMTVDPTGRFLYTVDSVDNAISMFSITPTTGLLTSVAGAPVSVGTDPRGLAIDPSGQLAYVVSAGTTPSQIQGLAISAATGGLTSVMSPLATGTNPQAVATDPTGRFVYTANTNTNYLTPYVIDLIEPGVGALTAGNVSTATGSSPTELAVEPGGKFVYVTNQVSNSLAAYSINQTTGNLTRVSNASIPSGTFTTPIAIGLTLFIE